MITSMRRCVACDDLWPWPISSRSFDLDLENRVRSVASTVLDGFLLYLAQMITIIRGFVACYVFFSKSGNLNFWQIFEIFRPWPWKKILRFSMDSFHIHHKWSLVWEGVLHVMTFDLDLYLQGHSTLFWLGIQHDSIVWVIMRRRGYPQNAGVLVVLVYLGLNYKILIIWWITLRCISRDLICSKSLLVQIWHQAITLTDDDPSPVIPYGDTRSRWVN